MKKKSVSDWRCLLSFPLCWNAFATETGHGTEEDQEPCLVIQTDLVLMTTLYKNSGNSALEAAGPHVASEGRLCKFPPILFSPNSSEPQTRIPIPQG